MVNGRFGFNDGSGIKPGKPDFKRQRYYFLQCLGHPQEGKKP